MGHEQTLSVEQQNFLREQRVARIATLNRDGMPHMVPICFAFDGESIYTTLGKDARRLSNIARESRVSIMVDRYEERNVEWTLLRGILMYGDVEVLDYENRREVFMKGWRLLIEKYPQYKHWASEDLTPRDADRRRVMKFDLRGAVAWGFQ